jgi:hypothetical protein
LSREDERVVDIGMERAMIDRDRDTHIRDNAAETRLQADPMLRPGRAPYAWPIAIALAVLAIAVLLFATNQEDSEVADTASPAITTGAAPTETTQDAPRDTANAPPAKQENQGTTGASPSAAPPEPPVTDKNQ